jgi:hypothetical protein
VDYFTGEQQPWHVWLRMFERIAKINGWEREMAHRLFSHLRGPAHEVACGLQDLELEHYACLVRVLESQFGPSKQSELHLAELRNRKMKSNESFREIGRDIKKMSALAYNCCYEERERQAKADFITALPDRDLRVMVLKDRPASLEEAIRLAEENSGYRKWAGDIDKGTKNQVRNVSTEDGEMTLASCVKNNAEGIKQLQSTLNQLANQRTYSRRRKPRSEIMFYNCHQVGHYSSECQEPRFQENEIRPTQRRRS